MPIDWDTVPDARDVGEELLELMRELFPIPRSLTGDGVRETLAVLARDIPLEVVETPSGTPVFDWTVPREWNLRGAWIDGPDGTRIVDVADSPLHVLGYSVPVDAVVDLDELRDHVFTHAEDPDLIPYRTSYWKEQWGFCMSRRLLDSLRGRRLPRRRSTRLSRTARSRRAKSISAVRRTPSSCSAHTSAIRRSPTTTSPGSCCSGRSHGALAQQKLRYTYRLLWSPGTLGPLCWLARNLETLDRVEHGLVVSCVGDPGPLRYKRSRRGDAAVDRAAAHVLAREPGEHRQRLAADRWRRAAVLLARLRPARRHAVADATRPLPRVPLVSGRPRLSSRAEALAVVLPSCPEDHRPGRDERDATATSRRTASRSSAGAASTRASLTGRTRSSRTSGC